MPITFFHQTSNAGREQRFHVYILPKKHLLIIFFTHSITPLLFYLFFCRYPRGFNFDMEGGNIPLNQLRFLGMMSFLDPPKPKVVDAVLRARQAGTIWCVVYWVWCVVSACSVGLCIVSCLPIVCGLRIC